jgi:hypothetical protein
MFTLSYELHKFFIVGDDNQLEVALLFSCFNNAIAFKKIEKIRTEGYNEKLVLLD